MKLTRYERQVLINQLEIRKALSDGSTEFDEHIEILSNGYETFYDEVFTAYSDSEIFSVEDGRLALDILDMYRALEDFMRNHPKEGEALAKEPFARFRGFDGNNETGFVGFVRFLVERQNKFSEQKERLKETDGFNSHMPTLDVYGRMLTAYAANRTKYEPLKPEQARAVVAAAKYPHE